MDKKSINKLLLGIKNGSNEDFATLYEETKRGLFSFLYTYYEDYYKTEDAMQSVFLKIKLNIDKYRNSSNATAWILEIAKNYALNELKSKKYSTFELNENIENIESMESAENADRKLIITDMINKNLSKENARILTLHIIFGYKHREIGKIMGMPTGTVTSRYKRSIEKIRKVWLSENSKEGENADEKIQK